MTGWFGGTSPQKIHMIFWYSINLSIPGWLYLDTDLAWCFKRNFPLILFVQVIQARRMRAAEKCPNSTGILEGKIIKLIISVNGLFPAEVWLLEGNVCPLFFDLNGDPWNSRFAFPQCIHIWDVSKGSANLKAFDSDRCHSRRESLMKTMNIRHETCWAEADESTDHSFGSHWSPQMNSTFLKKGTIVSWQTDVFCSNDVLEGQMSSCSLPHSPRFWLCGCVELTLLTPQTLWISRSCARDTCRQDNQMESSQASCRIGRFPSRFHHSVMCFGWSSGELPSKRGAMVMFRLLCMSLAVDTPIFVSNTQSLAFDSKYQHSCWFMPIFFG